MSWESNLRPPLALDSTDVPVQRILRAILRIAFHVMGRLPRSSCEIVECSMPSEPANARNE
jgi:hypothetical protein